MEARTLPSGEVALCRVHGDGRSADVESVQILGGLQGLDHYGVHHAQAGLEVLAFQIGNHRVEVNHYDHLAFWGRSKVQPQRRSQIKAPIAGAQPLRLRWSNPLGRAQEQLYILWKRPQSAEVVLSVHHYDEGQRWLMDYRFQWPQVEASVQEFHMLKSGGDLICALRRDEQLWDLRNVVRKSWHRRHFKLKAPQVQVKWPWLSKRGLEPLLLSRLDAKGKPWSAYPEEKAKMLIGVSLLAPLSSFLERSSQERSLQGPSSQERSFQGPSFQERQGYALRVCASKRRGAELLASASSMATASIDAQRLLSSSGKAFAQIPLNFHPEQRVLVQLLNAEQEVIAQQRLGLSDKALWLADAESHREALLLSRRLRAWFMDKLGHDLGLNPEGLSSELRDTNLSDTNQRDSKGSDSSLVDQAKSFVVSQGSADAWFERITQVWPTHPELSFMTATGLVSHMLKASSSPSREFLKAYWERHQQQYLWPWMETGSMLPEHELWLKAVDRSGAVVSNLYFECFDARGVAVPLSFKELQSAYRCENFTEHWWTLKRCSELLVRVYHAGSSWVEPLKTSSGLSLREAVWMSLAQGRSRTELLVSFPWRIDTSLDRGIQSIQWHDGKMAIQWNPEVQRVDHHQKVFTEDGRFELVLKTLGMKVRGKTPLPSTYRDGELYVAIAKDAQQEWPPRQFYQPLGRYRSYAHVGRDEFYLLEKRGLSGGSIVHQKASEFIGLLHDTSSRQEPEAWVDIDINHSKDRMILMSAKGEVHLFERLSALPNPHAQGTTALKFSLGAWWPISSTRLDLESPVMLLGEGSKTQMLQVDDTAHELHLLSLTGQKLSSWSKAGLKISSLMRDPARSDRVYLLDQRESRTWLYHLSLKRGRLVLEHAFLKPLPFTMDALWAWAMDHKQHLWILQPERDLLITIDMNKAEEVARHPIDLQIGETYQLKRTSDAWWILRPKGLEKIVLK